MNPLYKHRFPNVSMIFRTKQRFKVIRWIVFFSLLLLLSETNKILFHNHRFRIWFTYYHVSATTADDDSISIDTNKQICDLNGEFLSDNKKSSDDALNIILIKIGGSSITDKSIKETLNETALIWFGHTIAQSISNEFRNSENDQKESEDNKDSIDSFQSRNAFIIIHGAGSFGHHTAKEYGLKGGTGRNDMPPKSNNSTTKDNNMKLQKTFEKERKVRHGIAQTRLSVQKLNQAVVSILLNNQINAVGISPCFAIPGIDPNGVVDTSTELIFQQSILYRTIQAGIVPVLHGDACLYDNNIDTDNTNELNRIGGILSGDALMEIIGKSSYVKQVIFITDVDGVYNQDPKTNPDAQLIRTISVNRKTGDIDNISLLDATVSSHAHDVTGGLKVRTYKKLN